MLSQLTTAINYQNMAKVKKDTTANNVSDSASKIEVIKNLIFGENIAEYNSEFETLKKEIDAKRKELQNYINDTRDELLTSIDNLAQTLILELRT